MEQNKTHKSYLKAFEHVKSTCPEAFKLTGQCLLVEEVPKRELKTISGLILHSGTKHQVDSILDNQPMEVRVLLVGEGFYDEETGKEVPLSTKPGDVILVGKLSVKWLSSIAGVFIQEGATRIGLLQESDTQLLYNGSTGYEAFGDALAEGMTK